jgi:hypothetical protein
MTSRWQKLAGMSADDFEEKAANAVARMCLQRSGFYRNRIPPARYLC